MISFIALDLVDSFERIIALLFLSLEPKLDCRNPALLDFLDDTTGSSFAISMQSYTLDGCLFVLILKSGLLFL